MIMDTKIKVGGLEGKTAIPFIGDLQPRIRHHLPEIMKAESRTSSAKPYRINEDQSGFMLNKVQKVWLKLYLRLLLFPRG
jgi:hypothetical protein